MSDLLIKNIELPEEGLDFIAIDKDGHVYYPIFKDREKRDTEAIVLADHGDLIERDSLFRYDCIKPKDSVGREQHDTLAGYEVYDMIENAPVIIPSNREGQNYGG